MATLNLFGDDTARVRDLEGEGLDPAQPTTPNETIDLEYQCLVNVAAEFSAGLFSATGSGRGIYIRKGAARGRRVQLEGKEAFIGVAVFMELGITTTDISMNLSLPFLAAQATIGAATINYQLRIQGYKGDTSAYIRKGLFNVDSYAATIEILNEATKKVIADTANYDTAQVLGLVVEGSTTDIDLVAQGVAMRFALARVKDDNWSVETTLNSRENRFFSDTEANGVKYAYRALGINGNDKPTGDQRQRAAQLLEDR